MLLNSVITLKSQNFESNKVIIILLLFLCELTNKMCLFLAHFVIGIFTKNSSNSLYRLVTWKQKGVNFKDKCNL